MVTTPPPPRAQDVVTNFLARSDLDLIFCAHQVGLGRMGIHQLICTYTASVHGQTSRWMDTMDTRCVRTQGVSLVCLVCARSHGRLRNRALYVQFLRLQNCCLCPSAIPARHPQATALQPQTIREKSAAPHHPVKPIGIATARHNIVDVTGSCCFVHGYYDILTSK